MGIRKISLIIGIAVVILGLNYLLNLYNEKFVDVNSKDYIIEQFTKENIGNKKYFKQHGNVIGDKDYVILDDNNVEEYIYTTNNTWASNGKIEIERIGNETGVEIKNVEVPNKSLDNKNISYEKVVCKNYYLGNKVFIVNKNTKLGKIIHVAKDINDIQHTLYKYRKHIQANDICTTNVTNMSGMFNDEPMFNQPLNNWDTSNVTNMSSMFYAARQFNQPLNSWDTSKVKDMDSMFRDAVQFNQPLNSWDTSNVTNMKNMFSGATEFNQPLNSWDTSNVTNMSSMFNFALSFNQPLDNWNTSNVTNMKNMFSRAKSFNQPLNNWNTSNVKDMDSMFSPEFLIGHPNFHFE